MGGPSFVDLEHPDRVEALALAPDGTRAFTACRDGALRAWDVGKRTELWRAVVGRGDLRALCVSPDGRRGLAAAGHGGDGGSSGGIWDLLAGREVSRLEHDGEDAHVALAFSADGVLELGGTHGGTVRLWNDGGGKVCDFKGGKSRVDRVAFSPDRRLVAAGSQKVFVWETETGKRLSQTKGDKEGVTGLRFSADGARLLWVDRSGFVHEVDVAAGKETGKVVPPPFDGGSIYGTRSAFLTPDGRRVLSVHDSPDGSLEHVRLWDREARAELACVKAASVDSPLGFAERAGLAAFCDGKLARLWRLPA